MNTQTTPVLTALNSLTDFALENIRKQQLPPAETMIAPTTKYLFGHQVKLTPMEQQSMNLAGREQIITDWQEAKNIVYKTLEREGVKPQAIVPENIFINVLDTLRILPLPHVTYEGKMFTNPFIIDLQLSSFLNTTVCEPADYIHSSLSIKLASTPLNPLLGLSLWSTMHRNSNYGKVKILGSEITIAGSEISFAGNYNNFYDQLFPKYYGMEKNPEEHLAVMEQSLRKTIAYISDSYNLYRNICGVKTTTVPHWMHRELAGKKVKLDDKFFQGSVIFAELPLDFQKMLVTLKSKFPQWSVYTAADPDFFRVMWQGRDMLDYAKQRSDYWLDVFLDLKKRVPEMKQIKEQFQKKFESELAQLGIQQKRQHSIWSEEGLREAIEKEKDPIFYACIRQEYKSISYDMTIVWGQTGESPREQQAIEQLKAVDHSIFMGTRAN